VETQRQLAAGRLDATERVRLPASAHSRSGRLLAVPDAVEVSLRDPLVAMLTFSDNVAAGAVRGG